jgi:nitrite reductase/ring-hydroxylating ferredoxin subunit
MGRPDGLRERVRHLFGCQRIWPDIKEDSVAWGNLGGEDLSSTADDGRGPESYGSSAIPDGYEVALHVNALGEGEQVEVFVGDVSICLAKVDGQLHAVENACPHAGAALSEGELEGQIIRCPLHGWEFDLSDGQCGMNEEAQLRVFDVQLFGEAICVRV